MPVCPECGALFTEKTDDGWYSILVTFSVQVPSEDHCIAWLDKRGVSEDTAEQVALAMHASIRWEPKKQAWMYNGKPLYVIWRVFQTWCLRDLRQNGQRPGTGMRVKKGY